jgi:hypothetical protein
MTIEITPPEQKTSSQKELARLRVAEGIRTLLAGDSPASLLALAAMAPISVSKYSWMSRQVCGRLASTAQSCFGQHTVILCLVECSLRQIIFACLSEISRNPEAFSAEDRARFAADALTLPPKALLASVFRKEPPAGLVGVIGALGEAPRQAEVYQALWSILDQQRHLAPSLAHSARGLSDEEIQILSKLPAHNEAISIAKTFGSLHHFESFFDLYEYINKCPPNGSDLDLIARGANPFAMLRKAYHLLPFPDPPSLPGLEETLEFLPNGRAVAEAAIRLENCARNWIGEALSGQVLFYLLKGDAPAMLSLERGPFGLRLKEMKSEKNRPVDYDIASKLEADLRRCGVRIGLSVEQHFSMMDDDEEEGEMLELA